MKHVVRLMLSLALAAVVLWWMYRGADWEALREVLRRDVRWEWMLWSLPFGVMAEAFRALRWRQALEPLGEAPRRWTCLHAVFVSYASSLLVPRVGEVLRCAVLRRWDGTGLARSVGTVVTERVVDVCLMLLIIATTVASQLPTFARLGLRLPSVRWELVAVGVLLAAVVGGVAWRGLRRSGVLRGLGEGLGSVRFIRQRWLFLALSVGIWVAYYLHFRLTFWSFPFTASLTNVDALVAFVVGSVAVLVPTPNGAGPWHWAVSQTLILWGIGAEEAALFVLVVHTLQTLLMLLLGLASAVCLPFYRKVSR